jgi:hypothetical protein
LPDTSATTQVACDCLLLIFGQPATVPVEQQSKMLFPFEFMDTFGLAWTKKSSDQMADYQFQKKLAQVYYQHRMNDAL